MKNIERFRGGPMHGQDRQVDHEVTDEFVLWAVDPSDAVNTDIAVYQLKETSEGKAYVFRCLSKQRK